ncbi:ribonuclease T [Rhodoblastus acidophilus]|uniref:Ribonuclease T n=1 Tax=Rhodoblastus acidophilus TaxID=1074 RepID=A0A6N8DU09_RHOAC|nr:ribonuclease T2 [Rhodoblastus acidophilus]MCW2274544.1 ribonuclease T2 [Rhodoblastus acidophilus]MTV32324.1 ribonuclease T [Rhodoblastus acidophilus]
MKVWAVAAALLAATPVGAANDCILDNCADQRPARQGSAPSEDRAAPRDNDRAAPRDNDGAAEPFRRRGTTPSGDFDYYLLSLSWSPSFCATGGAERSRRQCAPGANPGFVVHGLWQQYARGYPPNCDGGDLPYSVLTTLNDLYPDPGLARHEWRAHGACSGKSPQNYFADVRAARDAVAIPPELKALREDLFVSPLDIQRAFIAANPRLRPGMMTVTCQRGALQEARICLSRDLRDFVACPDVVRRGCRSQDIVVPAGR